MAFGQAGAPTARVGEAVRASCAIPAYFEPAVIDGERYVDGGVHSTTNADLVAGERPDLVLVSAPMSAARGALRLDPMSGCASIAGLSLAREVAGLRAKASRSWRSSRRPRSRGDGRGFARSGEVRAGVAHVRETVANG